MRDPIPYALHLRIGIRPDSQLGAGVVEHAYLDWSCRAAPHCQRKSQAMIDTADLIRNAEVRILPPQPASQSLTPGNSMGSIIPIFRKATRVRNC
jgi:hypothetical protein